MKTPEKIRHHDVLILGAGPAGCSCALTLASSGLDVAVADRAVFPREKVCGDGISVKAAILLKILDPDLEAGLIRSGHAVISRGARFVTSRTMGSQRTPVPDDPAYLHGQVCERSVFDHALIRQLEKHPGITLYQGTRITGIDHGSSGIECQTGQGILLRGQIAVGAFGTGTGLLEMLAGNPVPAGVQAFAIRGYFRNVTGFREDHAIELFFADELLPGYLWLFPLPGDRANAGIYFPSLEQRKHFKDPVALFRQITEKYPQLKKRFRDAVPEGPMKGGTLPVWTSHQKLSGERYMLCGDAASLVDPFTGEGIANAILSGRIAAETIKSCFSVRDFSAESLSSYDKAVYGQLGEELSTSRMLLDMLKPSPEKVRLKSYRISVDRMLEQLSTTYWDIGLRKKVMQDFTPAAGPPRKGPALRIPGNWAIFRKRSR